MKYNDSDSLYIIQKGYNESTRCLMFHSTKIEANKLQEALDLIDSYNEFDSKKVGEALLETFGDRCDYVVGREYSVVVYVVPKSTKYMFDSAKIIELAKQAYIDEADVINGRLRLWWD